MKIYHLCQIHKYPFEGTVSREYIDDCLSSQLEIATFINEHPNIPIVLEGLYENYEGTEDNAIIKAGAKIIFPHGIPNLLSMLNEMQRKFLYDISAVRTLYYLNIIKKIYRSIHPEISATINAEVKSGNLQRIFKKREEEAMSCISEIVDTEKPESLILVFGSRHDFSDLAALSGYEYERINTIHTCLPLLLSKDTFDPEKETALSLGSPPNKFFEKQTRIDESTITISLSAIKGSYPIATSGLTFNFAETSFSKDDFLMSLMDSGGKVLEVLTSKQTAHLIISLLDNREELTALLRAKGKSMTEMADFIDKTMHSDFRLK